MKISPIIIAVAITALSGALCAEPIPDACRQNGFAIGCQAYSFNRYTVFEAIEKTAEAGGKIIEFYPGQKLSKEDPETTWSHDASDEVVAMVQEKLNQHGLRAVNYGCVRGKDAAEWRRIFEFGKRLGIYAITTEDVDKLDIIEPLVEEFDICIAIHNHPRRINRPNYKVWDPQYVLKVTKDRDPRIGACADTGHWQTSGINPVFGLRVLKGRVISCHLKDKLDYGPSHDVPYGTGVGEIGRCLDELKKQEFVGNISIEYEYNWESSVPEITKCIEFVRDYKGGAAKEKDTESGG
jgi:sugar phosphate isomerase/epimerase